MDISDKNFKPCPCGYQICQFCYNNIRQNPELNGRCPGCRRLYDDESVEYKTLSAEEYKSQQVKKERRDRDKKQKEKEKKELDIASKRHLAGLRVVQKNLVYVTGLNPPCPSEDLHSVLRSEKYFGQYGKILKIVINRKAPSAHSSLALSQSIVVYVTFSRKEDASRCINELDGSLCDGKILRAAHGTTKYCLSYLRGHSCPNPNCMFLHEPGEEADSYTRKDLSTHQGIKMGMSGQGNGGVNLNNLHHVSDDEHFSEEEKFAHASPAPTSVSNATPTINHSAPVLPATAHWAKVSKEPNSASASPSVANAVLANAAAFPTLGEIFKEQKTQKKDHKKQKGRSNKDGLSLPDDVDLDDFSVTDFADDTMEHLRFLDESKQALKVYFDDITDANQIAPYFHFDEKIFKNTTTAPSDDRALAIHVIERFLLRPLKKYHLAYLNQPAVSQQLQFLQQQAQLQQQATQQNQHFQQNMAQPRMGTPLTQDALQEGQQLQPLQQQQQQPLQQQQQQQQQMLLMQLQQLQLRNAQLPSQLANQQYSPAPQATQLASQLNALRMSEKTRTSTPPPPGLFSKNLEQTPSHQNAPQAPPSSSSQLLTQIMSGKK